MMVGGGRKEEGREPEILQMKGIIMEQLSRQLSTSGPDCGKPWLGNPVGGKLKNRSRLCVCRVARYVPSPSLVEDQVALRRLYSEWLAPSCGSCRSSLNDLGTGSLVEACSGGNLAVHWNHLGTGKTYPCSRPRK